MFVLADAQAAFADPVFVRKVKELAMRATPGQTLVLAGPRATVPPELDGLALPWTCNDVTLLPPEFLRRGRFDEIFFVDLPRPDERVAILRIQLGRRGRDPSAFDVARLGVASDGFSGAELEGAIVSAMYRVYADGRELTTEAIATELEATVPLSRTRAESISELRAWARGRAVPASA